MVPSIDAALLRPICSGYSSTQPFHLTQLPNEMLFHIVIRYLGTTDAMCLALTCRRMHEVVATAVRELHVTQPYNSRGISELFPRATALYASRGAAEHLSDEDMVYLCRLTKLEVLHVPFSHRITLAGFAQLSALTSLRSLNLRHTRNMDSLLKRIGPGALGHLHTLDISLCDVSDAGIQALATLTSIRVLAMEHNCRVTDAGIASLARLTRLESLDVTGCNGLDGEALAALAALPINYLRATALSAVGRGGLAGIGALTRLETLFLDLNPALGDAALVALLARLPRLTALTLFGCRDLTDRVASGLQRMNDLHTLNLSSTNITGAALRRLATCPRLSAIYLRCCDALTGDCLAALDTWPALEVVDITGSHRVTDEALPALAAIPTLRSVRTSLDATSSGVTGLRRLRPALDVQCAAPPPSKASLRHGTSPAPRTLAL